MASIQDRRAAVEGEVFSYDKRFQTIPACRGEHTIAPKGDGGERGQWVCISCGVPLENPIDKDSHCATPKPKKSLLKATLGEPARHVLAWRSFTTGRVEVP